MRLITLGLLAALLTLGQEPQKPEPAKTEPAKKEPATQEAAKPEEAKQEEAKKEEAQAEPAPAPEVERNVTATIDLGYRWVSDVAGSFDAYRSVVNLGEGPRMMGLELSATDPSKRLFNRLLLNANSWGGDPYNTTRLDVEKNRVYRLAVDYRNIAYFNFLPSFANPGIRPTPGVSSEFFNRRSYDVSRRYASVSLDLLPSRRISPFFVYTRDSGSGRGITPFVSDANEYGVRTDIDDSTGYYSGGVHIDLLRAHITLEQGGSTFSDEQLVYTDDRNPGDRVSPILGQNLLLRSLRQQYGVTGDSLFSRALVTAPLFSWLDFYGQFLYSRPRVDVNYNQNNQGLFILLTAAQFYTGQQDLLTGSARMPRSSGNLGFELRPFRRLRVMESWSTDRFHNASSALLAEQLFLVGGQTRNISEPLGDRLEYNYSRQEVNGLFEITRRITLRGGHRYEYGDARVRSGLVNQNPLGLQGAELKRHVGLAGVNARVTDKLTANVDVEASAGSRTYFRTSLQDYQRIRFRTRYQVISSLALSGMFNYLNNENPALGVNYDFRNQMTTLTAHWTPRGGGRFSLLADYTRATFRSNISYFVPNTLQLEQSNYRERAHLATAVFDIGLPGQGVVMPRITFGGSMFKSAGSRPTSYYTPLGRVLLPVHKRVAWYAEWRYYGFGQVVYSFEGFRVHNFLTGLKLTL